MKAGIVQIDSVILDGKVYDGFSITLVPETDFERYAIEQIYKGKTVIIPEQKYVDHDCVEVKLLSGDV